MLFGEPEIFANGVAKKPKTELNILKIVFKITLESPFEIHIVLQN